MVPWGANGVAAVAAAPGEIERAAILGFAEAGIERAGGEWPPDERQQFDGTLATLRSAMVAEQRDRARERGAGLSHAAGVELALAGRSAGTSAA